MKSSYIIFFILILGAAVLSCSTENKNVYKLSVNPEPAEAGTVSPAEGEYDEGTEVTITAAPHNGWVFEKWVGPESGTANPVSFTMDSDKSLAALFAKQSYPLTVNVEGEGTVNQQVIQSKETDYEHGTTVELTASPADGWTFKEWTGDIEGSESITTITIEEEMAITAVFEKRSYNLGITVQGEGTVDEQIIETKNKDYQHGTTVELTANPAEGWIFDGWSGDLSGSENPKEITINEAKSVKAVFIKAEYSLTVEVSGNGKVEKEIVTGKSTEYEYGTRLELTATPAEGWEFVRWEGDLDGSDNPNQITIDEAKDVTSVFEKENYTLTIEVSGNGSVDQQEVNAKVTEYKYGSRVELTAVPHTDWEFMEWSGDIEGEQPVTEVLIDQNKVVNARFSTLPTVTTSSVSSIDVSSATSGGEITSKGNSDMITQGVCWSKNQNPTLQDNCTKEDSGSDSFTSELSQLDANTVYYVRAYAENEVGVSYGQEYSFQTLSTSWESLGFGIYREPSRPNDLPSASIQALTEYDGKLIVAGSFRYADDIETNNIAAWDGNAWRTIGGGTDEYTSEGSYTIVKSLTVYNGDLIAAGFFEKAGDRTIHNIARWDGSNWRPIGDYLDGSVNALVVFEDRLIAGGFFHDYGNIVQLVNGKWETIAETNEHVRTLKNYDGDLIAGGDFEKIGDKTVNHIARWDGNEWQRISFGFNGRVESLVVYNGVLVAGGLFTEANGRKTNDIARFIGGQWRPLGDGVDRTVHTMTIYDNTLIAGGFFSYSDGIKKTNAVARWTGSEWRKMADGFNHRVLSLYSYKGNLYAGGTFTKSGNKEILRIARWRE